MPYSRGYQYLKNRNFPANDLSLGNEITAPGFDICSDVCDSL